MTGPISGAGPSVYIRARKERADKENAYFKIGMKLTTEVISAPCLSDVLAKARVIKFGRVMCPVAVDLFDTAGKQVAVAQVNYMLLDRIPSR